MAYRSAHAITPGGSPAISNGTTVCIACSAAGIVRLVMIDGTFLDVYANVGTAILENLNIKDVNAGGTTATATVSVLS